MKTKFIFIAAFTLGLGAILFIRFGENSLPDALLLPIPDKSKPADTVVLQTQAKSFAKSDCETKAPLFDPILKFHAADSAIADGVLAQAFADPESVLSTAETNANANIALFVVTSSCPEKSESTQPKSLKNWCIGHSKGANFHPIQLLQRAAELGSEDAKLMYAVNAPQAAAYLRKIDNDEARSFSKNILMTGERLGIDAARHGNPDAYRYMSRAYEIGYFGPPDLEAAYAFALPLKAIGDKTVGQRLLDLERRLPLRLQNSARQTAFGCQLESETVIQKNPFS